MTELEYLESLEGGGRSKRASKKVTSYDPCDGSNGDFVKAEELAQKLAEKKENQRKKTQTKAENERRKKITEWVLKFKDEILLFYDDIVEQNQKDAYLKRSFDYEAWGQKVLDTDRTSLADLAGMLLELEDVSNNAGEQWRG
jgi:hypothetical protein